jgi:hypothetical protein
MPTNIRMCIVCVLVVLAEVLFLESIWPVNDLEYYLKNTTATRNG